jgi:hypothetical protein
LTLREARSTFVPGHGEPPTVAFVGNVLRDVVDRIGIEIRDAMRTATHEETPRAMLRDA